MGEWSQEVCALPTAPNIAGPRAKKSKKKRDAEGANVWERSPQQLANDWRSPREKGWLPRAMGKGDEKGDSPVGCG